MDFATLDYLWPPSEKSNGVLVAAIIVQLTLFIRWLRPPPETKQSRKQSQERLKRLREGTDLILEQVKKADSEHAEKDPQPRWQDNLPEASRIFGFIWDEVYDAPMTRLGLASEDGGQLQMRGLFDRVVRLQLTRASAFTEQAIRTSRSLSGSEEAVAAAAAEHKVWLLENETTHNEVESYVSGELLEQAIELAEKAKEKLGRKAVSAETQAVLAKCKKLRRKLEKESEMVRRIVYAIVWEVMPLWLLSLFVNTVSILGWTEFDRVIFTGDIGLKPLQPDGSFDVVLGRQLLLDCFVNCAIWWMSGLLSESLVFKTTSRFCELLKSRLMECVMYQDYEYFAKNASTLQSRISADTEKVGENLLQVPREALMAIARIVIKLLVCLSVAPWKVVFVCLAPIPFVSFVNRKCMQYGDAEEEKGRRVAEQANAGVLDVIRNMKTVRFFSNEAEELERFKASVALQASITQRCQMIQMSGVHFFIFCVTAEVGVASYVAGKAVASGDMKSEDVMVFAINMLHQVHLWQNFFQQLPRLFKMQHPIKRIVSIMRAESKIEPNPNIETSLPVEKFVGSADELAAALADLETAKESSAGAKFLTYVRVKKEFKVKSVAVPVDARLVGVSRPDAAGDAEVQEVPSVEDLKAMRAPFTLLFGRKQMPERLLGRIAFQNVDFHYPSDLRKQVLRGMTWEVQPGQKVGVCGTAGCGKSTTFELLLRLYSPDPTGGAILVDGVDIARYDVHYLRRRIGLVAQKTVLFKTTIRENLWYGLPTYPGDDKLEEACRMAQIWDDLQAKPDKLLTVIMDDGGGFSLGQEQRIAIARLILRKPDIILLDEATASLDPVNERNVQDALDNLMKNTTTTTLAIAHRLTTIKDSDKILYLNQGHVVEEGRHAELLKKEIKKEKDASGKETVIAGFYHNQWDTSFQETDHSVGRLREKIEELQYQIRMHEREIACANAMRFEREALPRVQAPVDILAPLQLVRASSTPSEEDSAPPPPLLLARASSMPRPDEEVRPRLQRQLSAHNQVY